MDRRDLFSRCFIAGSLEGLTVCKDRDLILLTWKLRVFSEVTRKHQHFQRKSQFCEKSSKLRKKSFPKLREAFKISKNSKKKNPKHHQHRQKRINKHSHQPLFCSMSTTPSVRPSRRYAQEFHTKSVL